MMSWFFRHKWSAVGAITVALSIVGALTFSDFHPNRTLEPKKPLDDSPKEEGTRPSTSVDQTKKHAASLALPFERVIALMIGIDKYPNLALPRNLNQAEADAKNLGDVFKSQFGYDVVYLLGANATKARIQGALDKYGSELGERDALIVFFAGHGQVVDLPGFGEAGYLVPSDAKLDIDNKSDSARWREQALDMQHLVEQINQMNPCHVLLIADACCSGFLTTRGALARWDLKNFLFQRSRTVLAATTRSQVAGDGQFTRKLIQELKRLDDSQQKATAASLYDLFPAILREVSADSRGRMTPQLAQVGEGDGMFVFVPVSIDRAEVARDLRNVEIERELSNDGVFGQVIERRKKQIQQLTTIAEVVEAMEAIDYRFSDDPTGKQKVWEEKFKRFHRNAASGDVLAMAALHFCFHVGLGTEKNSSMAHYWSTRADRVKLVPGLGRYLLGRCYRYGLGVSVVGQTAVDMSNQLYRESADLQSPFGAYAHGLSLLADRATEEQIRTGRDMLERAIQAGVLIAEVGLAYELLMRRPGFTQDTARALALYESASRRNSALAHFNLSDLYYAEKENYPRLDLKKAEFHLREAAKLGYPTALTELAIAFDSKTICKLKVTKDDSYAFSLYDRAAQAGNAIALAESARMLSSGRGTTRNEGLAKERLEAAVLLNTYKIADYIQGSWYYNGNVYPQDFNKALTCFRRGADKGDAISCVHAGLMYAGGLGFQVRPKWKETTYFHNDWDLSLHYLVKGVKLGLPTNEHGKKLTAEVSIVTHNYLSALAEDTFSFSIPPEGRKIHPVAFFIAAGSIASEWSRANPDTYLYFCEKAGLDPKTRREIKKAVQLPADAGPIHEVNGMIELKGRLDARTTEIVYQVKLASGKTYKIDLVSPNKKALDPYLILADPQGVRLLEDDDGGGELNSRITFLAPKDGVYRIVATSYNRRGEGELSLTIRD